MTDQAPESLEALGLTHPNTNPYPDYPYIRLYGQVMGSNQYYIDQQVLEARATNQPQNVTYRNGAEWRTTDDIKSRSIRAAMRLPELPFEAGEAEAHTWADALIKDTFTREDIARAHLEGQRFYQLSRAPWYQRISTLGGFAVILAIPDVSLADPNTALLVVDRGIEQTYERYVSAFTTPQLLKVGEWCWGCYHETEQQARICAFRRAAHISPPHIH